MALDPNDIFVTGDGPGQELRFYPADSAVQVFEFASGTGTLAKGTAVTRNSSTGFWQVFRGSLNEINTLTVGATAYTGGTFTLNVVNPTTGVAATTAAIAFNATAATVQAALEALDNVAVGDVLCVATTGANLGDANAVVTINWAPNSTGEFAGQNVTIGLNTASLTGAGGSMVLATPTAGGTAEANGTDVIKGFIWPVDLELSATGETQATVMFAGEFHIDDVPDVAGAYGRSELRAAIRTAAFRESGFVVQGLSDWIR